MAEPTPLREGIVPEFDVERELLGWLQDRLRSYVTEFGEVPCHVTLAFMGDLENYQAPAVSNSWSPGNENASRFVVNMAAAGLFQKRAME